MNWTWWDGKTSFEHYREEHALDTETLLDAARANAAASAPEDVQPAANAEESSAAATEEEVGATRR
jgi:hypothetical protein